MQRVKLRQVNNCLLALIILINLYIIAAPLLPKLNYWWQMNHTPRRQQLTQKIQPKSNSSSHKTQPTSQPNSLTVPAMLLDTPILEGPVADTYKILDRGIWRLPFSSTPDKGGNTVIVGHRFTYTNPRGIFYALDKVRVGDEIGVVWNNTSYLYKVGSVSTVPPTQVGVEAPTTDARLTLYTCTPLWNPKDRLVVVAELEKKS
jgi:LPXTG-site transpeptidase (sortase) family protein